MEPSAMHHVSVWLDDLAPERGAFSHALEWASCLGLPLQAVAAPPRPWGGRLAQYQPDEAVRARDLSAKKLDACANACLRKGVSWDAPPWQGSLCLGVEQFLRPAGLCVFCDALSSQLKEQLLHQSLRRTDSAVLVCPASWEPVTRVLVFQEDHDPANRFLESAAQVCLALQVAPIVLTVGRSAREAGLRQRFAQESFAAQHLPANYDSIVGWDVRTAVASAARWRRCSHVFVEKRCASSWWRWLRGDTMERLLGLSDSLTFLALPNTRQPLFSPERLSQDLATGKKNRPR